MKRKIYTSAREFYLDKREAKNDEMLISCGKSSDGTFWMVTRILDMNFYIR